MESHRDLKKAWQLTESSWKESTKDISNVNVGATKKEKLLESQKIREGLKKGPSRKQQSGRKIEEKRRPKYDEDNWEDDEKPRKKKFKKSQKTSPPEKKKDKPWRKKGKANEDVGAAAVSGGTVSHSAPGSDVTDDGGYDSDDQANIARFSSKVGKMRKRNESYRQVLDRAYNRFIIGESMAAMEDEEEDMGMDDEVPDIDGSPEEDMPDMDDFSGEYDTEYDDAGLGGDYEMGQDEFDDEGYEDGEDENLEARVQDLEARIAALEGGNGNAAIGDLGDEIPSGMEDYEDYEGDEEEYDVDYDEELPDDGEDDMELPDEDEEEELPVSEGIRGTPRRRRYSTGQSLSRRGMNMRQGSDGEGYSSVTRPDGSVVSHGDVFSPEEMRSQSDSNKKSRMIRSVANKIISRDGIGQDEALAKARAWYNKKFGG
jgi:hypothetical protein